MKKRTLVLGTAAAIAAALGSPAFAQFSSALNESEATAREAKTSQGRIEQLDNQTASLINDYRANLKQLEAATRYNASLNRNSTAQQRQLERLRLDIENVSGLQRAMQPLMEDMLAALGDIVEADIPFNRDERTARVDRLNKVMGDPDVSAAQRYRLIVEAYQIENEYGRTMDSYSETINIDGTERKVDILRVGRVVLAYQSLDGEETGMWNKQDKKWEPISDDFSDSVRRGIKMARKQLAVDLLALPVTGPEAAAK